jgi:acetyl esterase
VPIRLHHPTDCQSAPAIILAHGGGWIVGSLDTHDRMMRELAHRTGAVVVGVDYTLSPEAKFPLPVRQIMAAARFVHDRGVPLGIDPARVAFAGDSAGANLALAAFLWLRDEGDDVEWIKSLLLFYGPFGLQDSMSIRLFGTEIDGMSKADLDYYRECYLGSAADATSPYVDCLDADLTVPPTYLGVGSLDPLRDDSQTLAAVLESKGIPVTLDIFEGVLHAFVHYIKILDEAGVALDHAADFFRAHV